MSWKQWVTGELVRAADLQSYIGDQVIAVFPDAASRDATILTPVTGQHAWLSDTRTMTWWDGSRWAGDTGWRIVTPVNGFTGTFWVRRIGKIVYLAAVDVSSTGASSNIMWVTPAGFMRAVANVTVGMTRTAGGPADHDAAVLGATGVQTTGRNASAGRFAMSYLTDDPWPASLPGIPG